MDELSAELNAFLIRLGNDPRCVSEKVEHYMKHILHLLDVNNETLVLRYYGLFGTKKTTPDELARSFGMTPEVLSQVIGRSLRKLAVTPEWQMVKQFVVSSSPA